MKFLHVMRTEGYISLINPDHIEYFEPWSEEFSTAIYFHSGRQININETTESFKKRIADFDAHSITKSLDEIDEQTESDIEKVGA